MPSGLVKVTMCLVALVALVACVLSVRFQNDLIDVYNTLLTIFVIAGMLSLAMFSRRGSSLSVSVSTAAALLYLVLLMTTELDDLVGDWTAIPPVAIMAVNFVVRSAPYVAETATAERIGGLPRANGSS